MARDKVWYHICLIKKDELENEVLAKVKSKGLAYNVCESFKKIYGKDENGKEKVYMK